MSRGWSDLDVSGHFPTVEIDATAELFRVHRSDLGVEYFGTSGEGRFDPPRGRENDYGTCYLGRTPLCAFLEVFGRLRAIPERAVSAKALSTVRVSRTLRIADLTDTHVLGRFGINGDLSVGNDYAEPQRLSATLFDAGFDGVQYVARHDPSFRQLSVALFGPHGVSGALIPTKPEPQPVSIEVIEEAARKFDLFVVPSVPPSGGAL